MIGKPPKPDSTVYFARLGEMLAEHWPLDQRLRAAALTWLAANYPDDPYWEDQDVLQVVVNDLSRAARGRFRGFVPRFEQLARRAFPSEGEQTWLALLAD